MSITARKNEITIFFSITAYSLHLTEERIKLLSALWSFFSYFILYKLLLLSGFLSSLFSLFAQLRVSPDTVWDPSQNRIQNISWCLWCLAFWTSESTGFKIRKCGFLDPYLDLLKVPDQEEPSFQKWPGDTAYAEVRGPPAQTLDFPQTKAEKGLHQAINKFFEASEKRLSNSSLFSFLLK